MWVELWCFDDLRVFDREMSLSSREAANEIEEVENVQVHWLPATSTTATTGISSILGLTSALFRHHPADEVIIAVFIGRR